MAVGLRTTNLLVLALLLIPYANAARAEPATFLIELDGQKRYFTTAALLADSTTRTLEIPGDPAYGRPIRYLAIPLLELLHGLRNDAADTIEARATDGFVSQLSRRLCPPTTRPGAAKRSSWCNAFPAAGAGDQGPDLGLPMTATVYMTRAGYRHPRRQR